MNKEKSGRVKLVVSIVNFRTVDLTIDCLKSVAAEVKDIDAHVIVVDNASEDGSAETIAVWIQTISSACSVELISSPTNLGFSGGHNLAISGCEGEFYLILNSDAYLRSGFVRTILRSAEAQPQAGFFAPRIERADGTPQMNCFRFPGPVSEFIRGARTGMITRLIGRFDVPLGFNPKDSQIDWASFACILLRRQVIEQIGLMDEGYFLYFEDVEYCLRARRAGWRVGFVPGARVVHLGGGSGPVKSLAIARKRMPSYYYASRTRFFCQAHGRIGLLVSNLTWFAGRGVAQIRRLFRVPVTPMMEAESKDIWTNFLSPLAQRRTPGD